MLPAPARLSITTCCLKRVVRSAAMIRPTMSVLPPGGQGMMTRMVFSGQPAAQAPDAPASDISTSASVLMNGELQRMTTLPALVDRLIDELAHQRPQPLLSGRLYHHHGDQPFLRIDPERGAGSAVPVVLADRPRQRILSRLGAHHESQAPALADLRRRAGRAEPDRVRRIAYTRREMVRGHRGDRLLRYDAHAVQLAAIEEHLAEARIVGRRGDHAAA